MRNAPEALRIHSSDNVSVALKPLNANATIEVGDTRIQVRENIPAGHKIAVEHLRKQDKVVKYGHVIGHATQNIESGSWVHSHNLATDLGKGLAYRYEPNLRQTQPAEARRTFMGYRRANGKVGTRNEVWIINTVGCVNVSADRIARSCHERFTSGNVDGVYAFAHPYGCSQLGDDLKHTQKVLAGLMRNPNVGGVLVLGLGCENNQLQQLLALAGNVDRSRVRFFNSQEVEDEVEEGISAVAEVAQVMQHDRRTECGVADLVVGLKCGGSDGFSGVSANPLVGRIADYLTDCGGTAILTEVPEMFGAEQQLMNRAQNRAIFEQTVEMINQFKEYFIRHNQPIYENPSPGNKEGGLTTLEEKSLGAIQKGGTATVTQVLDYGEPVQCGGLALLNAPGNDAVSTTAQVASGATILLFTTGRGTPLGLPVPTVKVSSNSQIFQKKPRWIDFNAGSLLEGTATLESLTQELFEFMLDVASGKSATKNETNGYREIAIWKEGVTL
ncbi:MAG: UxaA family hydrolase [bacterium]